MAGAGLSAAEVSRELNVTPGAVSKWLNDDTVDLKLDNLFALANLTGFSARWIATGDGSEIDTDSLMSQLPPDMQQQLTALIVTTHEQINGPRNAGRENNASVSYLPEQPKKPSKRRKPRGNQDDS